MNDIELKKKAEELELRLNLQLQQFKNDSQVYILGGGIALVTGLISYGIIRRKRRKSKRKQIRAAAVYKPEHLVPNVPERERKRNKRASRSSSLVSTIKKKLFYSLLAFGQAKLVNELNRRRSN